MNNDCVPTMCRSLGLVLLVTVCVAAQPARPEAERVKIVQRAPTGLATFVAGGDGAAIPVEPSLAGARVTAEDFLRAYGRLFGVADAARQLVRTGVRADRLGHVHTSYQQVHKGVPVFSGELKVHQSANGDVRAANGRFYPISDKLNAAPVLSAEEAAARARRGIREGKPQVEYSKLVIVDPGWYGDPPIGAHLAHHLILTDFSVPVREAFFVDAHTGDVLDQWTLLEQARDRVVIDDPSGVAVRTEGDSPAGDFDADSAYDFSGDFYDYLDRGFGRDSYDDLGGSLVSVVNIAASFCPNAFWNGTLTAYCVGVATDDIVAHEFGHALTQHTADLIYQNQSGQLNESYSDIWGELIDLFNGNAAFPGSPGGTPWPKDSDYLSPGTDTPNALRSGCLTAAAMDVNTPLDIAGTYAAQPASFGPTLTPTGTTGDVAVVEPLLGCSALTNPGDINGRIALIERGDCFFVTKVKNAQDAGAIAAIVYNNVAGGPAPMGGSDPTIGTPSVGLNLSDGELIRDRSASETVNVTLRSRSLSSVRWLVGEDSSAFGGAIRDMWEPTCAGDPDRANHPLQVCNPNDNGGVHSGSGVPNHAFAIMVDGKTFNGFTVSPIGPIKAGAVWYRALVNYLTLASNFADAYAALNQAAADLVGQTILDARDGVTTVTFTSADAVEVDEALRATEMDTDGLCGSWKTVISDEPPPQVCDVSATIYADDFETGVNDWTVFNTSPPTAYDWVQVSGGLPAGRSGTVWFAADPDTPCDGQNETAVHSLRTPVIPLPASLDAPTLSFTHFVGVETFWDGGNVRISINGGPFQLIPGSAMLHNAYNNFLRTSQNTNPLAGQEAWTGFNLVPGDWGPTLIDLSGLVSPGDDLQFQFDLGKDGCAGFDGWYVDDFELFTCTTRAKFSQPADETGEDIAANIDWTDELPNVVLADDFISDGRPIHAVRWWGSDLEEGTATDPDGWFISFHEHLASGGSGAPALGLYFCDATIVTAAGTPLAACDGEPVIEYVADLSDCCLIHQNADSRSGTMPAQADAFFEEACLEYDIDIQALIGQVFTDDGGGNCAASATGRSAAGDFWGWHTTGVELGASIDLRSALSSSITMSGPDWLYGPWSVVTPSCSPPNMAFELLTDTPPEAVVDFDNDGLPDMCTTIVPDALQPCPNDFAAATTPPTGGINGDRLSRFVCVSAPTPPAGAGVPFEGALRIELKTMYNTSPGNLDAANVCPSFGRTQPDLSQFNGAVRWVGAPTAAADDAVPPPPDYLVAPLVCADSAAAVRDWSPAALGVDFPNADPTRIYIFGAEVVPCSVYEISHCSDPLNEASCSAPLTVLTGRLGDTWPPFDPASGQPGFSDIGATVAKFKSLPFHPGAAPSGGPPEWHALVRRNVVGGYDVSTVRKVDFIDIGKTVDGFKSIAYKEQGPCNPATGMDNCGSPCSTAP